MTGQRIKVAHVMAGAAAGGAELFFERLCRAQNAAGDDVLPIIRRNTARAARLRDAGLAPRQLAFGGALDFATGWHLRRVLRAAAPRVVVAWMGRAARFAPRGDWVLAGRLGGYYDLRRFRHCQHLIGNTVALAQWIREQGWPAERTHYLPNFTDDFSGRAPDQMGVPDGARLVVASGRLHRNKGFDVLIQAMRRLPAVHLVIAGEGPERAMLHDLARACGVAERVHMPGWMSDMGGLLAAADVFVCSSRHEPLGNIILEAWSARRPVIAAAADGPRELIRPNEDGMLVPLNDADALTTSLGLLLESPALAERLAQNGRLRWATDYAEAPVLSRWRQFLASVEAG